MDQRSKTKINRFKRYFPKEKLRVIDKKWFNSNTPKLKNFIKDWESSPKDKFKTLRRSGARETCKEWLYFTKREKDI